MCFPSLLAATIMFGIILCCILNCESGDVFSITCYRNNSVWPYFCKSCVVVMICFHHLLSNNGILAIVLIAGVLFPF